jgi:hypothetical protein
MLLGSETFLAAVGLVVAGASESRCDPGGQLGSGRLGLDGLVPQVEGGERFSLNMKGGEDWDHLCGELLHLGGLLLLRVKTGKVERDERHVIGQLFLDEPRPRC